jgi:chromosome segregation protein
VQDVAPEHGPDPRFERDRERPRETNGTVAAPANGAEKPPERDRRLSGVQEQPRARTPEGSDPQHALDQRAARAREQVLEQNRAARKREREQELSAPRERPRDGADALDRRQQRVRDKLERANRTARKMERMTDSALGGAERVVDRLHQLDKSLRGFDEALDDAGAAENIEGLGKLRSGLDRVVSLADNVEAPLRRARDRQQTWQAKRESAREKLRQFKTFQDSNRRKLGVDAGSVDQLTALRDKARALWSDDRDKKKDAEKKPKTLAERAEDLDRRRQQALQRLTARREENRRDEQRQERGPRRLKSGDDDFRG